MTREPAQAPARREERLGEELHRAFKLSPDPLLVEKVRDIIGLYLDRIPMRWLSASTRHLRCR